MGSKLQAWFQCFVGCDEQYELREIIYRCRKCGMPLMTASDSRTFS